MKRLTQKKRIRSRAALLAAALFLCAVRPLPVYADTVSDDPIITDTPTLTDDPQTETTAAVEIGGASAGSGSSSGSQSGSSSGASSGTSSGKSGKDIITDTPDLGSSSSSGGNASSGSSASSSASSAASSTASGGTSVSKPEETDAAEEETTTAAKEQTELSDTPSSSGKSKGGEISSKPSTGSETVTKTEAPAAETAANASQTIAQTPQSTAASTQTAVTAGPSSGKTSGAAGSVYANDAVTRISLDFGLVTPNHKKGNLSVARASVALSDGTWQNFDYDDNIHYAFYKLKDTKTDAGGTTWYIATVKARRFGDKNTSDGEFKTELWLNASDCITRSSIDVNTTNATRIAIVKAALSMLGKQYIYGSTGPDAYDCSGLVKAVCKEAGITVPRTSTQLMQLSGQITAAELRPGDLLVRAGHCGIYIGNGIFVHASDSSVGVVAEYLSVYNLSNKFTNYVNVVGD